METNDRNLDLRHAFTLVPVVANLFQEAPLCCSVLGWGCRKADSSASPSRHFFITCSLEIPNVGSFQPPYVKATP